MVEEPPTSVGEVNMAQPKPTTSPRDRIEIDPSAEKRLADILKCALATRSSRHGYEPKREKRADASKEMKTAYRSGQFFPPRMR